MENVKELINKARNVRETGDVEQALSLFMEINPKLLDDKQRFDYLGELGLTYYHLKEYDKAISVYKESEELAKSLDSISYRALTLRNLSRPEFNPDDAQKSLSLAKEARELAHESGRGDLVWFDHGVITSLIYNNASHEELTSWFEIEAQDLYDAFKKVDDDIAKWVWMTGLLMDRGKIFNSKADLFLALTIAEKFNLKRREEQINNLLENFK